ncbi:MAG TPA: CPBP family intramembrane glutamic endopeptidase [Pyrinomonadaceae bacterium]|nr:CPBP family intramembrane glutamic endopeptidase [Pyrinomonadaceae bacterium]
MSTPLTPLPRESYAGYEEGPPQPPQPAAAAFDPDSPPWSVWTALGLWTASLALMIFVPLVAIIPYIVISYRGQDFERVAAAINQDPNALFISIAATLPAHLITLALVWAVVTRFGRRPFWQTMGWRWPRRFGFWACAGLALALLGAAWLVATVLGVRETPFDQMLKSSPNALFATAFLATVTAPLIEELVYRGVLYPAFRRLGVVWAVLVVTSLFAIIHVPQYYNSPGTIGAIILLSLALTLVRAKTASVLPCFVIHLIFNGLQVAGLLTKHFYDKAAEQPAAAGALETLLPHAARLFQ